MRSLIFFQLAALTALGSPALANETHKPVAPVGVQAENSADVPGTVRLTWQAVKGITEYVVASSRETEASYQSVAVTPTASYEFVDLPQGTKYYFRVACNTKSGQGPWSTSVLVTTTPSKGSMAAVQRPTSVTAYSQPSAR